MATPVTPRSALSQSPIAPASSPLTNTQTVAPKTALGKGQEMSDADRQAAGWRWVEVEVLAQAGKGLPDERCQLFKITDGTRIAEAKTDKNGVVKFWLPPKSSAETAREKEELDRLHKKQAPRSSQVLMEALYGEMAVLVFPDILEGFELTEVNLDKMKPPSVSGTVSPYKCESAKDTRRFDFHFHVVPLGRPRFQVKIGDLTAEEKFQYIRWIYQQKPTSTYQGYRGYYEVAGKALTNPRGEGFKQEKRWLFPKAGVKCNAHVNFFLGYWFNYNEKFSPEAPDTEIAYLTQLDSSDDAFTYSGHNRRDRGYSDFMSAVTASGGTSFKGFQNKTGALRRGPGLDQYPYYIRMSQFFDWDGNLIQAEYDKLVEQLADFNVYSVSDLVDGDAPDNKAQTKKKGDLEKALAPGVVSEVTADPNIKPENRAAEIKRRLDEKVATAFADWMAIRQWGRKIAPTKKIREWLVTRKTEARFADLRTLAGTPLSRLTDEQIRSLTLKESLIWHVLWLLDESRTDDRELMRSVRDDRDYNCALALGHHCGVLLKRGPKGEPLTGAAGSEVKLWKFSADNDVGKDGGEWLREYGKGIHKGAKNEFMHLAIWRLKDLRTGGFAPQDQQTRGNRGKLSLDSPPRFIFPKDPPPQTPTQTRNPTGG